MRGLAIALVLILGAVGAWVWLPTSKAPVEQTAAGASPQRGQGAGGGQSAILVVTAPVREADVQHSFEALGTAMSNEAITITSKVTGIVRSIN